jgi:two-component system response regulator FixJ
MDRSEVYLIDDNACVRRDLTLLLDAAGVASRPYDSALAFLRDSDGLARGCILADMRLPDMDGLTLLGTLKARHFPHPVIMITGHAQIRMVVEAFQGGAFDYLEKPLDDAAVLGAVHAALAADADPSRYPAFDRGRAGAFSTLTPRERQVLRGLMDGQANKVIARHLSISARTVEIHRASVMSKSGARSLAGLVRLAVSLGGRSDRAGSGPAPGVLGPDRPCAGAASVTAAPG